MPDPLYDSGTFDTQQELLAQQLARAQAMRMQAGSRPAYGWGGGLGQGLASLFGGIHESQLEGQQKDLLQKQQQALSGAGAEMGANAGPDQQRGIAMRLLTSGNKQFMESGKALLEALNYQQTQLPQAKLEQEKTAQQIKLAGPQEALGGLPPSTYEMLTKREQVPKFQPVQPGTSGFMNTRSGQYKPLAGGNSLLDPAALDQVAEMFHTTGQLPSTGMGAAGAALRRQIINRSAELHPEANLAGNKAAFHADEGSLTKMQQMSDSVDAFERTSLKNLQQFLDVSQKAVDTGSPLLNKPARWFTGQVLGDPAIAEFNTARQVAVNEIAKVLNNPAAGGGAVSDSARHEIEGLIGPNSNGAQIQAAAKILIADLANRKQANAAQISEIKSRLGGGQAPPQPFQSQAPAAQTAPPVPPGPAGAAAPARPRRTVNGETREWDGKAWVPIAR